MSLSSRGQDVQRLLMALAALVVITAGLRAASQILVPFLLSVFIAIVLVRPFEWLIRARVPRAIALLILVSGTALVLFSLTVVISASFNEFYREVPANQQRLIEMVNQWLDWIEAQSIALPERRVEHWLDPGQFLGVTAAMFRSMSDVLKNSFLILLTVMFLLLEVSSFNARVHLAARGDPRILDALREIADKLVLYLALKTVVSVLLGICIWIFLVIMHVDFPLLWAVLAFMLNYIPVIGSFVAAIPGVMQALLQFGPLVALFVVVVYWVINTLIGSVLEPRLMGHGVGLSPLVVFMSMVFWGWVLGPVGMFLSVPLSMALVVGLASHPATRWIAIMLGSPPSPQMRGAD